MISGTTSPCELMLQPIIVHKKPEATVDKTKFELDFHKPCAE